jgi:fumarate reductase subunit D
MFRKVSAILLSVMVLLVTVISILAIWDIIEVERILSKSLGTLVIIFVASTIVLFIYSVVYRDENNGNNKIQ